MPTPDRRQPDPLIAGLAGALVMTATHETARRLIPTAPRLDSLGRRALDRLLQGAGIEPPDSDSLQVIALAGDLAFNAGLFAVAVAGGSPRSAPGRGAMVGALAGLATLEAPPWLGIGPRPGHLPPSTRLLTIGLYTGGGWVAGLVYRRRRAGGS